MRLNTDWILQEPIDLEHKTICSIRLHNQSQ